VIDDPHSRGCRPEWRVGNWCVSGRLQIDSGLQSDKRDEQRVVRMRQFSEKLCPHPDERDADFISKPQLRDRKRDDNLLRTVFAIAERFERRLNLILRMPKRNSVVNRAHVGAGYRRRMGQ
jgi:hypothetical protein